MAAVPTRLTIFNLDTLEPAGEIAGVGGNGTVTVVKENSPSSFEVEQNLKTMDGARDTAARSRGSRRPRRPRTGGARLVHDRDGGEIGAKQGRALA